MPLMNRNHPPRDNRFSASATGEQQVRPSVHHPLQILEAPLRAAARQVGRGWRRGTRRCAIYRSDHGQRNLPTPTLQRGAPCHYLSLSLTAAMRRYSSSGCSSNSYLQCQPLPATNNQPHLTAPPPTVTSAHSSLAVISSWIPGLIKYKKKKKKKKNNMFY